MKPGFLFRVKQPVGVSTKGKNLGLPQMIQIACRLTINNPARVEGPLEWLTLYTLYGLISIARIASYTDIRILYALNIYTYITNEVVLSPMYKNNQPVQ